MGALDVNPGAVDVNLGALDVNLGAVDGNPGAVDVNLGAVDAGEGAVDEAGYRKTGPLPPVSSRITGAWSLAPLPLRASRSTHAPRTRSSHAAEVRM